MCLVYITDIGQLSCPVSIIYQQLCYSLHFTYFSNHSEIHYYYLYFKEEIESGALKMLLSGRVHILYTIFIYTQYVLNVYQYF